MPFAAQEPSWFSTALFISFVNTYKAMSEGWQKVASEGKRHLPSDR
jgi:hypothetical protein